MAELSDFENDLLESIRQAVSGDFAAVHKPKRGRPKGSRAAVTKEAVKLRIDPDVLAWYRAQGAGWQTRMNAVLKAYRDASL